MNEEIAVVLSSSVQVAVGVVFNPERKILVALRPNHKVQGGFWEFPGGKIEPGETPEQALHRELLEEVDITIQNAKHLTHCEHHYKNRHVSLSVWHIDEFEGEPYGKEGQEIAWVTLEELQKLPVLSANYAIVNALKSL